MPRVLAVVLLMLLAFSGCGGDGSDTSSASGTEEDGAPAKPVRFPDGSDKTMRALRATAPEKAVFVPSVSVLDTGTNRVGFALFDVGREQLAPEAVAVYVSDPQGRGLRGPFRARRESLRVKPQFMSRQTAADLDEFDAFWVADVPFPKPGRYVMTALASLDGQLISSSQLERHVGAPGGPPAVGDRAVVTHTETVGSADGDIKAIDTRIPPLPELHAKDFADLAGEEPVVLAFATPEFCQTRVCGPVVDVMAQVRNETEGVTFIHQEVYANNDPQQGYRAPVSAWRLPTEPWTFVIDSDGRIAERFEGAISVAELNAAVREMLRTG